jgi:hypothetical protein
MRMGTLTGSAVACIALLLGGTFATRPLTREAIPAEPVQAGDAGRPPERPRETVDIPALKTTGRTIHVAADGSLQAAIDDAKAGDLITLEPRATYRGPFRLPRKSGDGWIVIASASPDLPKPGKHVEPSHASVMPKLVTASGPVFKTDAGAHHYRLVGLEIAAADGEFVNTLIEFGDDESSLDALPHHLIVDRSYIHGDKARGARRGIALNARHAAVVDSYLADFKEVGADTQAIAGWNGAGPFKISRNYLEASGENIMFGGADPAITNLVPSDIEITRNHITKPLRWKSGHADFEGVEWTVKNLLELKNARRVLIDGNLLEHNWPQAQNGFAILFTVRNQDGDAPWSAVEDVIFSNNLVRHVAAGINMLGRDDNQTSQPTRRIAIRNNVFLDVGGTWGNGRLFQMLNGVNGVSIEQNTAAQTGSILAGGDSGPHTNFVFQNNVAPHNEYGISGSGTESGNATLAKYFPGALVRGNVIAGGAASRYPKDNSFPETADTAGATHASPLQPKGTRPDRTGRPGADVAAVERALGGLTTVGLRTDEAR